MRTWLTSTLVGVVCATCAPSPPPPPEQPPSGDEETLSRNFCERFIDCGSASADYLGSCEIELRNSLIRLRNQEAPACDEAAAALASAYACLAEEPCAVVQDSSQWATECDDWRVAREQSDLCEGGQR